MSEAVKYKDNNASLVHISLCSSHSAHQKIMSIFRSERMNMTLYFLQISLFSKRLYHLVYIHHRENIPPQCFVCPFFSKGKWKLMTQGKRGFLLQRTKFSTTGKQHVWKTWKYVNKFQCIQSTFIYSKI